MSHSVVGVVSNSYQKDKPKRAGGSVTINYCDVDGFTFSTGFKQMFQAGEHIDIEVEHKYGEWQFKSLGAKGLPSASSAPAQAAPVRKAPFGGGGRAKSTFPVDQKDGQMSIIRQSSMNRAVEIMGQLVDTGLVELKNKDEYMDMLVNIALEVTDFGSGNDITQLMKAQAAAKEAYNG